MQHPGVKNGMATAGMICGIVGILLCWFPFIGVIAGLLGIIFGAIGMSKAGRLGGVGRGAGVAGLVTGIISLLMLPIMAAIAIPAFLDYMHKSKSSESSVQLTRIERRIKAYYIERAELPPSTNEMPGPASAACGGPNHKFPVRPPSEWHQDPGWAAIDFEVSEPSLYTYKWTRETATRGTIEAIGDLDCDLTLSTTRYDVTLIEGDIKVTRNPPTPD
jgi:type II secretory pathway pseudopilin PulG